jgi:four helix bundle protein
VRSCAGALVLMEKCAILESGRGGEICHLDAGFAGAASGMNAARVAGMAVLNDLIVYRLASELRLAVITLTDGPRAVAEYRLRDQLRAAAGSVVANIAEGYGRAQHNDFARFLDHASGSLRETEEWLRDGIARRTWSAADAEPSLRLAIRLTPALTRLKRYLRNSKTPSF